MPRRRTGFRAPGSMGQTGYTGLLVETAAVSDTPDWKEMLNWGENVPEGHPLRRRYPHRYADQVLPEAAVPGITEVLITFHRRMAELQRRFLRIIALGLGAAEGFFDELVLDGSTLTRAIHYPAMNLAPGADHICGQALADINLITALPNATSRGCKCRWGSGGPMLRRRTATPSSTPASCWGGFPTAASRSAGTGWPPIPPTRASVTRSCSLSSHAVDHSGAARVVHHAGQPAALLGHRGGRPARPGAVADQPG